MMPLALAAPASRGSSGLQPPKIGVELLPGATNVPEIAASTPFTTIRSLRRPRARGSSSSS